MIIKLITLYSAYICRTNSYPLRPRRVTWIKTKREGVKNGRSSTDKPSKLGLRCKADKCRDAGTGDLGVLATHVRMLAPPQAAQARETLV